MHDPKLQPHGDGARPQHRPYWQRMHHSPFFWVAAFFIMLAMTIYVMTNNLAIRSDGKPHQPVSALAP